MTIQTLIIRATLATFAFQFDICLWHLKRTIQQAYKYLGSSLSSFELKVTSILKSCELPAKNEPVAMETVFFTDVAIFPVDLSTYQVSMVCERNTSQELKKKFKS